MRMLGRLELAGGWNHTNKHIPGAHNTLAEGNSRWTIVILVDKVKKRIHPSEKHEQPIGRRRSVIFDVVLQTKNTLTKHDDFLTLTPVLDIAYPSLPKRVPRGLLLKSTEDGNPDHHPPAW